MLSTFEAENRHLDKHTEPQLKKRCAYKKKKGISKTWVNEFNYDSLFDFPNLINWIYSANFNN